MANRTTSTITRLLEARRVAFLVLALGTLAVVGGPVIAAAAANRAATTSIPASATVAAVSTRTATVVAVSSVTTVVASPVTSRTLSVPVYYQVYSLSCEESALRMALASEGINVTDAQVLQVIGTDTRSAYYGSSGLRWGDPYTTFVGNPSGSETNLTGYGTYYPAIATAASALGGKVLAVGEGVTPATVYASVLAGHPVVVWVTWQWVAASRQDYIAFDGRVIPYAGPVEHAVTVVGVTPTDVIVNDPDFGRYAVSRSLFEARYATYNDMAVVLN